MLSLNARISAPQRLMLSLIVMGLVISLPAWGQINTLTKEEMIKYTAANPYDRFPDGRPKVPDAVLEQFKDVSSEELMSAGRGGAPVALPAAPAGRGGAAPAGRGGAPAAQGGAAAAGRAGGPAGGGAAAGGRGGGGGGAAGGSNQFTDGWQILHPGKKLIGRAVTLQLMPTRADVASVDSAEWRAKGNTTTLNHQSALDVLQPGDVIVMDAFGSLEAGGIIGDNLAYYIWKKTGTGFVIDGSIRDLEGISTFDMAGYYRWATPPAISGLMVTGINVPIRIGKVTVMPGDIVFGDREGVNFIPPQAAQRLLDEAKTTHIHDEWTRKKFDEGKYKSTDIYGRPTDPALVKEYEEYLKQRLAGK